MALKQSTVIIPEYKKPDAVMVPHYVCSITPLLEEIASRISRTCGVILLSSDETFSQTFIETQKRPEHFSIITATFDTPWIRDRSPVAIKVGHKIRWCIPRIEEMERPNDDQLFSLICADKHPFSPIEFLAQGNMVAGSNGLIIVTDDVLTKNDLTTEALEDFKVVFGVRHWLVFSGFEKEITGHADVHIRVLGDALFAVAWNLSSKDDRYTSKQLIEKIQFYKPKAKILKIPIHSVQEQYASLVNWIQIGRRLLIPRYDNTPKEDLIETRNLLRKHGFKPEFIYSPTLEYGGSLHCLTASIYV